MNSSSSPALARNALRPQIHSSGKHLLGFPVCFSSLIGSQLSAHRANMFTLLFCAKHRARQMESFIEKRPETILR